ncbi:MAG: fucose isomerase, partial [Eubacterium sp.]|nr:fucose isomerase [Eubacterium sp.]
MSFSAAYIPIGVPTFHLESAQAEFEKSIKLLKCIDESVEVPDEMLLSIDKLNEFMENKNPDLLIVQNITFANAAYISEVLRKNSAPVLLWTLREPVIDGGRLRLNSLTGAYSAANALKSFERPFEYIFGSPEEERVKSKISAVISAARIKKELRSLNLLQVGHTPQGFCFGRALDAEVMKTFGSNLLSIEARELIDSAKSFTDDEIKSYLEDAKKRINGLDDIDEKNVLDFARLYKAYADYVEANNIGALSSRCWPDFFVSFGTPVCSVLGILNDLGVSAACEADTYGALSMFICQKLTGKSVFFGDPVSMDENENTLTFWH